MDMIGFLIGWVWFASVIYCAWLAKEKDRFTLGWLFLGIAFGPISLLVLISAPSLKQKGS